MTPQKMEGPFITPIYLKVKCCVGNAPWPCATEKQRATRAKEEGIEVLRLKLLFSNFFKKNANLHLIYALVLYTSDADMCHYFYKGTIQ